MLSEFPTVTTISYTSLDHTIIWLSPNGIYALTPPAPAGPVFLFGTDRRAFVWILLYYFHAKTMTKV